MSAAIDLDPRRGARTLFQREIDAGWQPVGLWPYDNADGQTLFYKVRLNPPTGSDERKLIRPMHLSGEQWTKELPSAPAAGWPLYRLPELLASDGIVYICEGEKAADALRRLEVIATTSGGTSSASGADWTTLKGRSVRLWPDSDKAGAKYAADVAKRLHALGCTVAVLDLDTLGLPDKGDAADWVTDTTAADELDALPWKTSIPDSESNISQHRKHNPALQKPDVPDVLTVEASNHGTSSRNGTGTADVPDVPAAVSIPESERPCFRVYEVPTKIDGAAHKLRPGVYLHGTGKASGGNPPPLVDTWICGPLYIEAQTSDAAGNAYGRLLQFQTTRGDWRTWSMPMELLRGSGEEMRGELLSMGLSISPDQNRLFGRYLQALTPTYHMRCATTTGWCGDTYVFPDTTLGPDADSTVFQSAERVIDTPATLGTLECWRDEIAVYAVGNPILLLALSVSFTGPLLQRCHAENGGIHIVGDSSCGKTTALEVAVSVWGGPDQRRSWRATANGLEGAAALHNDGLLALDEISECEPREVGAVCYMVANGQGKQRAKRTGTARPVTRWRCALVSTGERTIGATMAEGGHRQKAGQGVRLLDVPADGRHGAFDDLHRFSGGREFADHLKAASGKQYGHAAREFVERLASDTSDHAAELEIMRRLPCFDLVDLDQQEKRVAGRFALYALAGELATSYGITGWPEGAATEAVGTGFQSWRTLRGKGRDERRKVIGALADFIDRHADGRFSATTDSTSIVRDRAGWWEDPPQGRVYLFTSVGMHDALQGFDFRRGLDVLERASVIPPASASGERAKPATIQGRKVKVYRVSADALGVANVG